MDLLLFIQQALQFLTLHVNANAKKQVENSHGNPMVIA